MEKWTERNLLFGFIGVAALLLLLFVIGDFVWEGSRMGLETRILLLFRNSADLSDPLGAHWVEDMVRDITALGGVGIIAMLLLIASSYLYVRGTHRLNAIMLLSLFGGMALSGILKIVIDRPRPAIVPLETYIASASFPSGHSLLSAVTYLTLGAMLAQRQTNPRVRRHMVLSAILITVLVGLSRLYLGVHWPTDVLGGWLLGAAWATIWLTIAHRIRDTN